MKTLIFFQFGCCLLFWTSYNHSLRTYPALKCPYSNLSCQHCPVFWLNTEIYSEISVRVKSKYGKRWTREASNTNIFYKVLTTWVKEHCLQLIKSLTKCWKPIGKRQFAKHFIIHPRNLPYLANEIYKLKIITSPAFTKKMLTFQ